MLAHLMSEAILKPRGFSRLETGHPWIFKSDVEPVEAPNGEIVDVVAKGRFLGQAFYSQHSEVTLRMLSRGALASTWLVDRIEAAIRFREETLGMRGACRLVHGESDGLPGLIVDRYGDVRVVQVLAAAMEAALAVRAASSRAISACSRAMRSANSCKDKAERSCPISCWVFFRGSSSISAIVHLRRQP